MNRRQFLLASALLPGAFGYSSQASAQRSRNEILIGQSLDLSGLLQNQGRDFFSGAKIALDEANAGGGVGSRRLRLIQLDDTARPEQAIDNTRKFLQEERVDLLFGYTSDACVDAVLKSSVFQSANTMLFAPMCGIDSTAVPERVVYLRASYADEVATMLERFFRIGWSSLAIAHTSAPTSLASRDIAVKQFAERYSTPPRLLRLDDNGANAVALSQEIARNPPHAIAVLADTIPASLFVRELMPRNPGLQVCVASSVNIDSLKEMLGIKRAAGLIVSRVVPEPTRGITVVARDYARVLNKYFDEAPSAAGLEGYIAARTLIAALSANGGNPQALNMAALRSLRRVDLGGWAADFRKGNRASQYVDMAILGKDGSLKS